MNEQIKIKKRYKNVKYLMILTALVFWFSITLYSNQNGIAGKTSTTSSGCDCHSGSANSATTVTNTSGSGSYTFAPGSVNSFTVTVAHATKPKMGVDIAVKTTQTGNTTAGTLSPGSGLKTIGGELVHISPITMSGGQATVSFTWTAPATPGTYYLRAIGNAVNNNGSEDAGDIWNWMTVQTLTVSAPGGSITVSAPNGGESWCGGTSQNITWTSSGVTTVKIELSSDGGSTFSSLATGVTASAGTWAWNIPSGQQAGNQYKVKITDESNASVNDLSNANFTISQGVSITAQPQSASACTGSSAQFSVTASGSGLTYQWRKNSVNINGATASTYSIPSVSSNDAASYDCVLSGSCGSPVTSNAATLTINVIPAITSQPQNQTVCQGGNSSFSVTATGTNLVYQWKKNGVNISGATNSTYSILSTQSSDAGQYTVDVSGDCPPTQTSQAATLTVNTPPQITTQPSSDTACEGQTAQFTVVATGTNITYQWKKNGANISGATNATLSITNVQPGDAGQYTVDISGDCTPSQTSQAATLSVSNPPQITTQPAPVIVCAGQPAQFNVVASGTNLTYKWYKNGTAIPGATAQSYSIASAAASDSGSYYVEVSNTCTPAATSTTVKLTVNDVPAIVSQPAPQSVQVGATATFSVNVTGANSYQWRKNNSNLQGQTTATLTLNNVQLADSGNYDCALTNDCGNVTSESVKLSVMPAGAGILSLNSQNINFGIVMNGEIKDTVMTGMMTNTGSANLMVTGMTLSGKDNSEFTIVNSPVPCMMMPNETKNISLKFTPTSGGWKQAVLNFSCNTGSDQTVTITGKCGVISVEPSKNTVKFDSVNINTHLTNSFTLNNTGNMGAKVTKIDITGNNALFFTVVSPEAPFTIDSGSSQEVSVNFSPLASGLATAQLDVAVEKMSSDIKVDLNGTAIFVGVNDFDVSSDGIKTYPNPSGNTVNIEFDIKDDAGFEVAIYDILGNKIKTFDDQFNETGKKILSWDGTNNNGIKCGTGTYICMIKHRNWIKTIGIDLIR